MTGEHAPNQWNYDVFEIPVDDTLVWLLLSGVDYPRPIIAMYDGEELGTPWFRDLKTGDSRARNEIQCWQRVHIPSIPKTPG